MNIDLRLLRSFVVIYEQRSLARAAKRLHCTSAALSMRLKQLETEVGEPLFDRRPGGVEATPRGSDLYARAVGLLAVYDELVSATRSQPARERVRLGLPDDYAAAWLGRILKGLKEEFDRLEIEIVCDLSSQLLARLHRREIDLALVTLAARPTMTRGEARVGLRWIGSGGNPVALAAYPEGCLFRQDMIRALDAAHRPWRVAVQSANRSGIIEAVRTGLCATAVAAGTAPEGIEEIISSDTLPALPDIPIYLLGMHDPRPAVARVEDGIVRMLRTFSQRRDLPFAGETNETRARVDAGAGFERLA